MRVNKKNIEKDKSLFFLLIFWDKENMFFLLTLWDGGSTTLDWTCVLYVV